MPRRFHTKSRFGCNVCKKRRVKCDERQPTCGACARIRAQCEYSHSQSYTTPDPDESELEPSVPHVAGRYSASMPQPGGFDVLDLTLMHHYATKTYKQLFTGEKQSQVLQNYIPTLGVSNKVLFHGILAVTALHRAQEDPHNRNRYWTRALHHHEIGLPPYKALVAAASPETAELIVVYAILLGIWVYVSPSMTNERLSLDDVLNTVEVARKGRSVFHLYRDVVMETPICQFLVPPHRGVLLSGSQVLSIHETLESLRKKVEHPSEQTAVDHLRTFLDRYLSGTDQTRAVAHWMASVGEDFWSRLRSHHRYALLVFAYSSLLACVSENECWWVAGWSERIMQACSETLSPDDKEIIGWEDHRQVVQSLGIELLNLAQHRDRRSEQLSPE